MQLARLPHFIPQPFRVVEGEDDNLETSIYFGTSFLGRLGYFDPGRRFWTDEAFPESEAVRQNIERFIRAHLNSGGESGHFCHGALQELRVKQEKGSGNTAGSATVAHAN